MPMLRTGARATFGIVVAALTLSITPGRAQTPIGVPSAAVSQEEAARITSGWLLLSQGKSREAANYADALLSQYPDSPAVLAFAIEAAIAGRGSYASLDTYEYWFSSTGRTVEQAGVLGRIALALLHEWSRQNSDTTARIEALKALARAGVSEAVSALAEAARAGGLEETRALVSLGDASATDRALSRLKSTQGLKVNEILILGESRSPRVVPPLIELLKDERPENRAEAATALGKIGQKTATTALKPLLNDPNGVVRLSAAAALLRLDDFSGIGMLRELAGSEYAAVRRSAAALLASQPDEEWKNLVRGLASDPDPSFRLDAARLLAPYDEALSRSVLEGLLADPNPEIRNQAGVVMARDTLHPDVTMLRRLLRVGPGVVRVAAADRLLKVLR